jgi:hypothetical protein
MAAFPKLKTLADAQYGFERVVDRAVAVQRYLDGTTRRFASERAKRSWRIRFEGLSAQEAERVAIFVARHLETQETFTFHDPWNGLDYHNCVVPEKGCRLRADGEHRYRFEISIEQQV